jgi:hypothetical protein
MDTGRWSEFNVIFIDPEAAEDKCAEIMEMSGEEGEPLEGRRVGVSELIVHKRLLSIAEVRLSP